ncbi:mitofusin [Tulasnella sp. 331]|nr:mitofusin [Tulasnella sp. 331]
MPQSYFSLSASAPVIASPPEAECKKETTFTPADKVAACKPEDAQAAYVEQKDSILDGLDTTKNILHDLRVFNKESWVMRYPSFKESPPSPASPNQRRPNNRRSLTFADDPNHETEVVMAAIKRGAMKRSMTLAAVHDETPQPSVTDKTPEAEPSSNEVEQDGLIPAEFNILRLDLKIGPHGSSTSPGALVSQLEKASIANLLDGRIGLCISHLDKLRLRVEDTSSKVLITGDLNAGKSTFVNAMLGRALMPVDQQPCTTMFCEVHDVGENDGIEEVHVVNEGSTYSRADESTYTRASISDLDGIVTESDAERRCILYVEDARQPSQSLLNNGVVDIALIDAPGLNRDSLKTTALFARQEEIDVVVFVVSAENHFTLSAKDFLWTASNEKAHLFIVVNKFDQIRDKAKCKRVILDQIKQLSPRTWDDANDLVHFVDSDSALARSAFPDGGPPKTSVPAESFQQLETALRSFVLVKRAKSKLMPATTYLSNVLSEIDLLAGANAVVAQSEQEQARADLERARPVLEKMKHGRDGMMEELEQEEDIISMGAAAKATTMLEQALEKVARGEIAVDAKMVTSGSRRVPQLPLYPGIFHVWDYATRVRCALLESLELAVSLAEDEARRLTGTGVEHIRELSEKHLPEGVERSRRVFIPEAMFSPRRKAGRAHQATVAGGCYGLGIGLLQREDLTETSFQDIFDVHHRILTPFGSKDRLNDEDAYSALRYVSIGLGAVTMAGGKAIGIHSVLEGIARVSDIFGNERSRRWVAPVVGAVTLGLTVYFVLELPHAIPRTIGRNIKASLVQVTPADEFSSTLVTPIPTFTVHHSQKIQKETRKVMRMAAWDLRESFRTAMEERQKEVRGAEETEARASRAMAYFDSVGVKTDGVREKADLAMVV